MRSVDFALGRPIYMLVRVFTCPCYRTAGVLFETTRNSDTLRRSRCAACPSLNNDRRWIMARKPATRVEFTLFDVLYEGGSQRSNRRVPSRILGGPDGDAPARAVIEEQDRLVAEKSGTPALPVKSIHRSSTKKADEVMRSLRSASASN